MLCGIHWWAIISKKNAYRLCRLIDVKVEKSFNLKRELTVNDELNSWKKDGKYKNWIIEIRRESKHYKLFVRGSLHKFFHGNNAGSFTGLEVMAAIDGLCNLFQIDSQEAFVTSLEVGVNIPVWFPVYNYLKENLLYHLKKEKQELKTPNVGFQFNHDDYIVKLYAKENKKLRFEIRLKSKAKLEGFSVKTISDLTPPTINRLTDSLLREWPEVIMRDGVNVFNFKDNPNRLTEEERIKLLQFSSVFYQQSYRDDLKRAGDMGDKRKADALRKKANRLRTFCLSVIKEKGDGYHARLEQEIIDRVAEFRCSWGAGDLQMSRFPPLFKNGNRDIYYQLIEERSELII